MQATNFSFSLYRLNIIDKLTLFPSDSTPPIRDDDQLISVIKNSTKPEFDNKKETQKATYQWSVREFTDYGLIEGRGKFISVILARSVLEQEGQVVTSKKIVTGISAGSPPLAETIIIFFDMSRHIAVVENSGVLARSKQWKTSLSAIMLDSAYSLNLTSAIQLEEIPEKHEILKLFFSFDRLTRLKVHLRLPNPELSRYTKKLFEDLQDGEIRDYIQDMKNPSGISTRTEARPHASAALAQAGYKDGDVLFEGYKDGEYRTIKSSEEATKGKIKVLKDYVRGIAANAKTKEAQNVLIAITDEIDRLHPRED